MFPTDMVKYITMRRIATIVLCGLIAGCSSIVGLIPSFNDSNQSAKIIDVRKDVDALDCSQPQAPQVLKIVDDLRWFELYSQSSGVRHNDVIAIIKPMQETADEMYNRVKIKDGSKAYCEIKKKIMATQAERAAKAILGRF